MSTRILVGDCRDVLPNFDAGTFAACVTDPPYEIGFMGRGWDRRGVAFDPATWEAVYRVLKPGGVLMAFGGTRTWHRLACAVEDAGFAIFDTLMWLYGSGFPKHKTLLKPAWEPVILAKKPGRGGLNTEAGRIPTVEDRSRPRGTFPFSDDAWGNGRLAETESHPAGRWPANVALDEEAAALLDAQSGERGGGFGVRGKGGEVYHGRANRSLDRDTGQVVGYGDTGGASRFYYCAKADRAERDIGMEGMPKKMLRWSAGDQNPGSFQSDGTDKYVRNHHPTVKPIALMRWLVRMACPPGGTLLDPFLGSGTSLIAAEREGIDGVGVELNPEYAEIARRRIVGDAPLFAHVEIA